MTVENKVTTTTRLRRLPTNLLLEHGQHETIEAGMCAMEVVSFIAREPFSDHPACACPVIGEFVRSWNDGMDDDDRQQLKPILRELVGSKSTPDVELRRSWMALDWYVRVSTPAWLRLAKLESAADAVESCAPITDTASSLAAGRALDEARSQADAARAGARAAARAAAWDAAGAAAWAAARAAGGAAAGAGVATRAVAGAAAWAAAGAAAGAAGGDAAGAGVATRAAVRPTVAYLQVEALKLIRSMLVIR